MNIKILIFIVISSLTVCFSQTTVNGRFISNIVGSTLEVTLQINTNTGVDGMGGATIPIIYSNSTLDYPETPVQGTDYIFHNFSGGNYNIAKVTKPNQLLHPTWIWINIDLPFTNNNNGTIVAGEPNWTDIVTLYFNILDVNGYATLIWNTTSTFWDIYDDNNLTVWQIGNFQNIENQPLPIELNSFNVNQIADSVILEWTTETEINSYGFDVEESINNNFNFKKIGFVNGNGNSNSPKHYRYSERITNNGEYFYRLRMIDNDGSYEYSEIVNINISNVITDYYLYLYPNPFNPVVMMEISIKEKQNITISAYNIIGELIFERKIPDAIGIYKQILDFNNYPSGVYIFKVYGIKFLLVKKGLLLK